ncbi:hypothetical protein [Marinitoga sp. 38H-ov]|uniref:hypothetical protein n=1 Tax=Marinitoga sp. 38H-ov TaxID=1755814 RepID=UPI0013E9E943|nr:hypothetical protein [Marinitoga sp. 38H-ov]KAF2955107.1 hypothetical protein AS160_01860 [Marinitoga sp. 38H-ov]
MNKRIFIVFLVIFVSLTIFSNGVKYYENQKTILPEEQLVIKSNINSYGKVIYTLVREFAYVVIEDQMEKAYHEIIRIVKKDYEAYLAKKAAEEEYNRRIRAILSLLQYPVKNTRSTTIYENYTRCILQLKSKPNYN